MNWQALDLNLLRVLDAMLADASTTRAADRIGLSQPAVSAALGRLRLVLDDPLFVREGNRMVPTRYAETLRAPLRQSLEALELALADAGGFQPERSTATFRLLGDDYLADLLLPGLAGILAANAPKMRVELLPIGPRPIAPQLADGSIDIAFDHRDRKLPDWVDGTLAVHAQPTIIASRSNRAIEAADIRPGEPMPLDLFCRLPQAGFSPGGEFVALEDVAVAALGFARHVAVTLPSFLSIARLVADSQIVGMIPARMAARLAAPLELDAFGYPFPVAPVPLGLFWHARNTHDPAHRWLRDHILRLVRPFDAIANPVRWPPAATGRRRLPKAPPRAARP